MAVVNFDISFLVCSPSVIFKAGTGFVTNYDNILYRCVLKEGRKVEVANGVAAFTDVGVYEGSLVTTRTPVSSALKDQRFKVENASVDLNTLIIRVLESNTSSVFTEYKKSSSILDIGAEDKIYFVNETEDENYEIFFGDGVLGKKLEDGQVVEMTYISTRGADSNSAKSFTFNGRLQDENETPLTISFITKYYNCSKIIWWC